MEMFLRKYLKVRRFSGGETVRYTPLEQTGEDADNGNSPENVYLNTFDINDPEYLYFNHHIHKYTKLFSIIAWFISFVFVEYLWDHVESKFDFKKEAIKSLALILALFISYNIMTYCIFNGIDKANTILLQFALSFFCFLGMFEISYWYWQWIPKGDHHNNLLAAFGVMFTGILLILFQTMFVASIYLSLKFFEDLKVHQSSVVLAEKLKKDKGLNIIYKGKYDRIPDGVVIEESRKGYDNWLLRL
ncbi:unnamed protein product [Caenorhabditis angaria]|uniref:Uncharacterized protein n=1 Tax=Caenorhabditis angaria TaxID=860376 RepID=A0A9P1MT16_9PELO|nr:unnamed protein product [Caenorhabditis angaria]